METIVLGIIGFGILIGTLYTIVSTAQKNNAMMTAQVESAKHRTVEHVTTLSFEELLKILERIMNFHIASELIRYPDIMRYSDEEKSLVLDDLLTTISTDTYVSMSEPLRTGLLSYVTEEYLKRYITDTIRLSIIARIELRQ